MRVRGLLKQIGLFSLLYGSMKRCKDQKCLSMNQKQLGTIHNILLSAKNENHLIAA